MKTILKYSLLILLIVSCKDELDILEAENIIEVVPAEEFDFDFTFTPLKKSLKIGELSSFNININQSNNDNVTYKMSIVCLLYTSDAADE